MQYSNGEIIQGIVTVASIAWAFISMFKGGRYRRQTHSLIRAVASFCSSAGSDLRTVGNLLDNIPSAAEQDGAKRALGKEVDKLQMRVPKP
jgi:hypothetical protein